MEYYEDHILDLAIHKIRDRIGYSVIEILKDDPVTKIFYFETKEEFDRNFEFLRGGLHRRILTPKNIITRYGYSCDCEIDGSEQYMDLNNIYLVVNGKLVK